MPISRIKSDCPWVWLCPELMDDEELNALPSHEWMRLFMDAWRGDQSSPFARYVRRQWTNPSGIDQ